MAYDFQSRQVGSASGKLTTTDKSVSFSGIDAETDAETLVEALNVILGVVNKAVFPTSVILTLKQEVVEGD